MIALLRRPQAASVAASFGSAAVVAVPGLPLGVGISVGKILHESFTDGAQLLLLGSMAIGLATGEVGKTVMQPFTGDLFKGMLAFFLLDMGLTAARNLANCAASRRRSSPTRYSGRSPTRRSRSRCWPACRPATARF